MAKAQHAHKVETVYIPCPMCATKKDDRALFSVRTKDGHHCMLCEDTGVARVGRLRVPDHG